MGSMSKAPRVALNPAQQTMANQFYQQAAALQQNMAASPDYQMMMARQMQNVAPLPTARRDDRLERAVETIDKLTKALAKVTGIDPDAGDAR